MKLCTFETATPIGPVRRVGVHTARGIVDATAARISFCERMMPRSAAERIGAAQVPPSMVEIIGTGPAAMEWISEAVDAVFSSGIERTSGGQQLIYDESAIRILPPVPRPPGVANFSVWPEHSKLAAAKGMHVVANEADAKVKPYWKGNPDSFVGPGVDLEFPPYADELDVECELVCIVGVEGRDLDREAAMKAIAGYTIVNDVSAREIQRLEKKAGRGPSKGKDFDGGNVMGPWLVTPDEVGDTRSLRMSLHVNGEEISSGDTSSMIWDFPDMLSYLSMGQTIHPGHVISGGCYPRGSALDLDRKLRPGDLIELRISRIGSLVNRIGRKPERSTSFR